MKSVPGAALIEAKPDLVGLTDLATLLKCSRQNVRKYMFNHAGFPKPVHTGSMMLWHLWELADFEKINLPEPVAELSKMTFKINMDIQQQRYRKRVNLSCNKV